MARAVVGTLLLLALGACDDTAIRLPNADVSPSCLEAEEHSDYEWIQEEIFGKSCSRFSSCHKGNATSAARLNLEATRALTELLGEDGQGGQPSEVCGLPQVLVVPGEPASSYLMKALDDPENPKYPLPDPVGPGTDCPEGDPDEPPEPMPYNNPPLCVQKRDAVERWIVSLGENADAGVPDAR